jgi:hypothetical protein
MKPKNGQRATLILLVAYSLDLIWKIFHWSELTSGVAGWGVALALMVRFAFMGFLLYLYLRIKKSSQDPEAAPRVALSSAFRTILIMHRVMLAGVIFYVFLAERIAKSAHGLPLSMTVSIGITAIVIALITLGYRMKMLSPAIEALRQNQQDSLALFRWRQAHILIMVLLLSVALLGFALRFIGASFWVVMPFYITSMSLLLLWAPSEAELTIHGPESKSFGN